MSFLNQTHTIPPPPSRLHHRLSRPHTCTLLRHHAPATPTPTQASIKIRPLGLPVHPAHFVDSQLLASPPFASSDLVVTVRGDACGDGGGDPSRLTGNTVLALSGDFRVPSSSQFGFCCGGVRAPRSPVAKVVWEPCCVLRAMSAGGGGDVRDLVEGIRGGRSVTF